MWEMSVPLRLATVTPSAETMAHAVVISITFVQRMVSQITLERMGKFTFFNVVLMYLFEYWGEKNRETDRQREREEERGERETGDEDTQALHLVMYLSQETCQRNEFSTEADKTLK